MSDFKGMEPPAVIGLVLGSSAEFYFQASAAANRVRVGKDVILKNIPLADQAKMPAEVSAIVPWDPVATQVTTEQKNGRAIDVSYPYNVYQGGFFVRSELFTVAPDVVQAITDALVEADLAVRANPDLVVTQMSDRAEMKALPKTLLAQQVREYNLLYKPTYMYPLGNFWGSQNQDIAAWLHLQGKIKRPLKREDYSAVFAVEPMQKTYAKLGWKAPVFPPYISADWALKPKGTRLPAYDIYTTMKKAQSWPERGDLFKPYRFNGKTYKP